MTRRNTPRRRRLATAPPTGPSTRRRGFATAMALGVVALAAVALASLAAMLAADGRRTRDALVDAQLRQLLLAGAEAAAGRLAADDAGGPGAALALPPDLAAGGGSLRLTVDPSAAAAPENRVVRVEAAWAGRRAGQVLRFHHGGGKWQLVDAQPGPVTAGGPGGNLSRAGPR